jgi:hypothetical protein
MHFDAVMLIMSWKREEEEEEGKERLGLVKGITHTNTLARHQHTTHAHTPLPLNNPPFSFWKK